MIKSLLILVNFLGLLILNFFLLQKIEVEHTIPDSLAPGESTEVSLTIDKGKVEGFAKLQINVDRGLSIEDIESTGASFTFSDQKAKFIWMSLPEDKEFTVKYRLVADSDAIGALNVSGHFSYIDDNQRLVYDLTPSTVMTGEEDALTEDVSGESNNADALAQVSRNITTSEDGRQRVTLTITKENLTGFAKLQELIPVDYTAVAAENEDAVFNIVDNKVKFVWFDIPSESELVVAYDMIPVTNDRAEDFDIDGEFSFLVDNETQTVIVNAPAAPSVSEEQEEPLISEADTAGIEEDEVTEVPEESSASESEKDVVEVVEAENWEEENLNNGEEKEDSGEVEEEIIEEVAEVEEAEPEEVTEEAPESISEPEPTEPESEKSAVSSMPETAISYRVQITAAHKLVNDAYFESMHQYTGPYNTEHHEGWIKYTTGGFDVYRSARDHRNELTASYNFPGPFVTAYNEGERITVQEALMIANQKWVP